MKAEVASWEVPLRCLKCKAENRATLGQIERGETIQCIRCGTKISLKDKDGNVARKTRKVQEAIDELEKALRAMDVKFR
jgi:DNA-directed RNA polymerase subunit RPC12/RpoP